MYSTVLLNEDINTSPKLIDGISKIMIIPSVVLVIFSVVFTNYSYSIFIKGRKREFGLFMNLGMEVKDIRKLILLENTIIAAASVIVGGISGTLFSRLFFMIICEILGVKDLYFHIHFLAYILIVGIFLSIYALSIIVTLISTARLNIIDLLKAPQVIDRNAINSPYIGMLGLIIIMISLAMLLIKFDGRGDILLACTIALVVGIYIFIYQFGNFIAYILSRKRANYHKNILLVSNLRYKYGQTKKIIFIITLIVIVIIFINGFYLNLIVTADKTAKENNPFHVAFIRENGKNNISEKEIQKVISDSKDVVAEHKKLEFIETKNDKAIIISAEELRKVSDSNLTIGEGKYIRLFQINNLSEKEKKQRINDENKISTDRVIRDSIKGFKLQDVIFRTYFNAPGYVLTSCIILNNNDYLELKKSIGVNIGVLELYNFEDWKNTQPLVKNLQEKLKENNSNFEPKYEDKYYLQVASRVGSYNENNQGAKILFCLLSFLGIFFLISISIILSLKLFSDFDSDKIQYKKLYGIGMMENEFIKLKCGELKVIFTTAPVIAIPIAITYSLAFEGAKYLRNLQMLLCDIAVSLIFILLEVLYYNICKRNYIKRVSTWI
jgi:hypothetical protein